MKMPRLLRMMAFEESRKVSFGWYLFLTATGLLMFGLISADQWLFCVTGSGALVGGGTLADKWIDKNVDGHQTHQNPVA